MRTNNPRTRRSSVLPVFLAGSTIVVLLVAGILGTLWASGRIEWPWARSVQRVPEGMVAIPLSARTIPRYTVVEREYLMNPQTGEWVVQFRRPDEVPEGVLTNIGDVRGRVTAKEKPAGFFFVEADFLPKGTRSGVSAGVPEGKRALTLEVDRVKGVRSLQAGDRVDMLASIPLELLPYFGGMESGWRVENALSSGTGPSGKQKRTETRMLASDAVIVEPVTTRQVPIASGSLTEGSVTRMVPVQEVVIAVDLADVALVSEAVDQQLTITCIAHSGRPKAGDADRIAEGLVEVPVAARYVPAYSRLVREDLVDVRTRFETSVLMREDEAERLGIARSAAELLGRVVARDVGVGEFFTAAQLLPPGTNPGVAAGIPPGKRSFTLDAKNISGAHALGLGDRFDLLATIPLDWSKTSQFGATMRLDTGSLLSSLGSLQKQAVVRVVVHDGIVISPVVATKINLPARLSQSKEAMQQLSDTAEQMIVAVDPDEAGRLAEAVALGLDLAVVCRGSNVQPVGPELESDHTDPVPDDVVRGWNPIEDMKVIETMVGGRRELHVLPADSKTQRVEILKPGISGIGLD